MTRLWLVEGTWGGDWAEPKIEPGTFRAFLRASGFECARVVWSYDVDGVPSITRHAGDGHRDWIAGGYGIRYRLKDVPFEDRNFLVHSHGIGPVLFQATLEDPEEPMVPIRRLLSVSSPPRSDMELLGKLALESGSIAAWRHIYADGWDTWARFGQVFDGHWGWQRRWGLEHPHLTQSGEKGVGHSGIFTEPERHRFLDNGHFDFLR